MINNDRRLLIHICLTLNLDQGRGGGGIIFQNLLGVKILRVKEGEHKITKVELGLYVAN